MTLATYVTTAHIYNGDFGAGSEWTGFGTATFNTGVQSNGFYHVSNSGAAIAADYVDDVGLPTNSTITNVRVRIIAKYENQPAFYSFYIRYAGASPLFIGTAAIATIYSGEAFDTAVDPNSVAWTVPNLFLVRAGVQVAGTTDVDSTHFIIELALVVTVTLPAPTATTNAATNLTFTTATVNGTINPGGATASFPVSYKFQWGLTAAYGNETTIVGNQTGSADIGVSANLSGLTGNTTYHYRVVATNADNTVNGADMTFATGTADRALMIF